MDDLRRDYLEQIRAAGVRLSPELAEAFASIPREAFVPEGFQRRDGRWASPRHRDFLKLVYTDDVLVTKLDGRVPVSSSSQPSLMAIMINALRLGPGVRVLEIGAGTGYNAALMASLGASVTTLDAQPDVASRARTALAALPLDVTVVDGDGYAGLKGDFDRIIVTVGIAGISPHWLGQLAPGGLIVAPVDHAGTHPVLAIRGLTATVVCAAGFMTASGPLAAGHPAAHPLPITAGVLTDLSEYAPSRFDPPLPPNAYRDLWFAAGAWHRRASHAAVPGIEQSCLALLDDSRTGGAVVLPAGRILTAGRHGEALGAELQALVDRWLGWGRPPMSAWRVGFGLAGDPATPIWVPSSFTVTTAS
jgi:protein-L-isoaspartate(D-aspartate) O-methyltransferase